MTECRIQGGVDSCVSIPRGGPIYVPDMVGPLTRVSDFQASLLQELQNLQIELLSDSLETCNEDISVDELKFITEEDLVNKSFEEAFKDSELTVNSSQEEHLNARKEYDGRLTSKEHTGVETSRRGEDATSYQSFNDSPLRNGDNRNSTNNKPHKRKRMGRCARKSHPLDESYIAKVEELVRIKQKQDDDKAAARLHSFNVNSRVYEKTERMTSLKSARYTRKVKPSNTSEHVPLIYPEVVLCVEVYHNQKKTVKDASRLHQMLDALLLNLGLSRSKWI